jgi:3-methyladenine DNA glycosylase AlkC
MKNISPERMHLLNSGLAETKILIEMLAIDFALLLHNVLPNFIYPKLPEKLGITKRYSLIAQEIDRQFGFKIFKQLKDHQSDTIRGLGCYLIGQQKFPFAEKLSHIKDLADDTNPGVREWAWIAIRPDFISDAHYAIKLLEPWTSDSSDNIRRFASELSRPRGVWCAHARILRETPSLGLPILEKLNNDPAKYVQLSVGNWLNDAGKDNPEWVLDLCSQWQKISPTTNTTKICKRALRNLL